MRAGLERESEWILAENLEKSQTLVQGQCLEEVDANNDFGSYRLLFSGRTDSRIGAHNATGASAECYAQSLLFQVKRLGIGHGTIADMGCGAGFIPAAVREKFPHSTLFAYDIAADAIAFAAKTFRGVTFRRAGIQPGMKFPETYDLVYANEFYPFTRTDSLSYYLAYLDTFLAHLRDGDSALIVSMLHQEKSLLIHLDEVSAHYRDRYRVIRSIIPSAKLLATVKWFRLAQAATTIANRLLGRKGQYMVVFLRK